jgi:glycine hydroxymethyltransferase
MMLNNTSFRSSALFNNIPGDSKINEIMELEIRRQQETVNLIAAENYASRAVLDAQGSVFTNKYAEGYPGRRYYSGCINVDSVETLAIERAKELYGAEHANVQPHSGSQANMAVYFSLLNTGDTVMGMMLNQGGHLTHGAAVNFSGKYYKFVPYGLDRDTELIDYDEVERLALEHKPRLIVAGASSYPRIIDFNRFSDIAKKVGAFFMVDIAHIAGFVATGLHPSPVPVADAITSSTHKTLRGPRAGFVLCKNDIASKIDSGVFPTVQGGPQVHAIAAKAICFYEALQPEFKKYQEAVLENARTMAEGLKQNGFRLVSGGTENHIILLDLEKTGITGLKAQQALEQANILANKNAIPFDKQPPQQAGGIRFGTPAVTTRGFGVTEISKLVKMISEILSQPDNDNLIKRTREEVQEICRKFPVPGID